MTHEFAEIPVLHGWITWLCLLCSSLLLGAEFKVVQVNNCEQHTEHEANDGVKDQESLEVIHNLTHHFDKE